MRSKAAIRPFSTSRQQTSSNMAGWQSNPSVQEYQRIAADGGKHISGAMHVVQGDSDPIVYPQCVTDAMNETGQADPSVNIEYHLLPNVSHALALYAGFQIYMDWIAAQFSA